MSHLSAVPSDPDELRAWLVKQGQLEALRSGLGNREVDLPAPRRTVQALTVDLTLLETEPRVWRELTVPGDTTLEQLHDVVQAVMGWTDSHLHRFHAGRSEADPHFVTPEDVAEGDRGTPEHEVRLDQLLRRRGSAVRYVYDDWQHELRLVATAPLEEGARPSCTGGAGACPPEDVGGPEAYAEVAAWVRDGRPAKRLPAEFDSLEEAIDWLGPDWHPDAFDSDEADLRVQAQLMTEELLSRLRLGAEDAIETLSPGQAERVAEWLSAAGQTSLSDDDLGELTAPYRILLDTVGEGVTLTQTGHLPPPVVKALSEALGIDPALAGKASREHAIAPLVTFRESVQRSGLLELTRRRLQVTTTGAALAGDPAGLWRHVASRLPLAENDLDEQVGWFALLAIAGGTGQKALLPTVHELSVDAGWVDDRDRPIAKHTVSHMMRPTLAALIGARWNSREPWPAWVQSAAASVLFYDDDDDE